MERESDLWMSRRDFLGASSMGLLALGLSSLACNVPEPLVTGLVTELLDNLPSSEHSRSLALWALINRTRQSKGIDLPWIPFSSKLTKVAQEHVKDIEKYHPENKCSGNLHSWSNKGSWKTPGCYKDADATTWSIMTNKPEEIAGYREMKNEVYCFDPHNAGYEIAHSGSTKTAAWAVNSWLSSRAGHKEVMLNQVWRNKGVEVDWKTCSKTSRPVVWRALGAAYEPDGVAFAWFGESSDL